jgi:predicted PhzF superfamily epimerase YddE/YHI9
MTQGAVEFAPPLREPQLAELLEALGLDRDDLDPRRPPQIVSTGHSKVLIGLKTVADVDQLRPDLVDAIDDRFEFTASVAVTGRAVIVFSTELIL